MCGGTRRLERLVNSRARRPVCAFKWMTVGAERVCYSLATRHVASIRVDSDIVWPRFDKDMLLITTAAEALLRLDSSLKARRVAEESPAPPQTSSPPALINRALELRGSSRAATGAAAAERLSALRRRTDSSLCLVEQAPRSASGGHLARECQGSRRPRGCPTSVRTSAARGAAQAASAGAAASAADAKSAELD